MDKSIHHRLLCAQDDFFTASIDGIDSFNDFQVFWRQLQQDIERAQRDGELSDETLALAQATASNVAILADSFLDLHVQTSALTLALEKELDEVFAQVSLEESPSSAHSLCLSGSPLSLRSSSYSKPYDSSVSLSSIIDKPHSICPISPHSPLPPPPFSFPPYIGPAYKWLIRNLYNPYPSSQTKEVIAKCSGTSPEKISGWFTHVRQRMGWTAISRKFYSNCRADIVDGAYRCFVQDDPIRPLESSIAYEFMVMKAVAENLYSAKFKKSTLAGKLDAVVKDMTNEDRAKLEHLKAQAAKEGKQRKDLEKQQKKAERKKEREARKLEKLIQERAQSSYPTPERSPYTSSEPSVVSDPDEGEEDLTPPEPIAGRKRRASSASDSADFDVTGWDTYEDRVSKRHKMDHRPPTDLTSNGCVLLPSPQSSSPPLSPHISSPDYFDYWADLLQGTSASPHDSSPATTNLVPSSRKRRLSESDTQNTPKRPRGLPIGPRLHAVSDPLPASTTLSLSGSDMDDWFKAHFDPPPAVTAEEPDLSTPLEIELFKGWTFPDDPAPIEVATHPPSTNVSPVQVQQVEVPDEELQSITPLAFDLSSLPIDNNIDFLSTIDLESLLLPTCHSESQLPSPPAEPTPTSSFTAPSYMHPAPQIADVDWTQLASCFYSTDTAPPPVKPSEALLDCQPQSPEDHSIFSVLQPSTPSPADILAQASEAERLAAEKRAKLEKLREHREAARRLEEELLSV